MQITDIDSAMKVLNEGIFLVKEMIKCFQKNPSCNIRKISLHVEYQTAKQVQEKSKDKTIQSFYSNFKF